MDRRNKVFLGLFFGVVLAVLGGLSLLKGGFYFGKHEGDTMHLLQIVFRMADGQWPHLDFLTPIGVFSFLPIVAMLKLGLGVGTAILAGQVLVALILFPAIWWVSYSRFKGGASYLFGSLVLIFILALVHGTAEPSVSISMHYNRWAWAVAFLVIATAVLPNRVADTPKVDGVIVGVGMAFLALIKVTYFIAFTPAVLVALIARRSGVTLAWAVISGLLVALVVTIAAGPAFWMAYLGDLLSVRASSLRPQPGLPFFTMIIAPAYMAASLLAIFAIIWLRQAGRQIEGLAMLFLVPGFFYATFQNFGNDPQWLALMGLMLWTLLPKTDEFNGFGWNLRNLMQFTALAMFALAAPSFINLAYSPFRHMSIDPDKYLALIPESGRNEDLQALRIRSLQIDARVPLDLPGSAYAAFTDPEMREDRVVSFQGEVLPECKAIAGVRAWVAAISADLVAQGVTKEDAVFNADTISSYWLYGAGKPLPGGSPWYYGGLPGIDAATYLLVPLCPRTGEARKAVLEAISERGETWTEAYRSEMYILFRRPS